MFSIRAARWPEDIPAIARLDISFDAEWIYRPARGELSFRLDEVALATPVRKCYPFAPQDPGERGSWTFAAVAERNGSIIGFTAAAVARWNRRLEVRHLYVDRAHRGGGVGTQLLAALEEHTRELRARCLWVETQNTNHSAIGFYLRSGFVWCGFDESLYDPDSPVGSEIALFFVRPVAAER